MLFHGEQKTIAAHVESALSDTLPRRQRQEPFRCADRVGVCVEGHPPELLEVVMVEQRALVGRPSGLPLVGGALNDPPRVRPVCVDDPDVPVALAPRLVGDEATVGRPAPSSSISEETAVEMAKWSN